MKTSLHIQQKVEMFGVRAQVQELWSRGGTVSCGAVTGDTRVAFRSSTAMVYLFIQMSSEMWDFDTCGKFFFFLPGLAGIHNLWVKTSVG